MRQNNTRQIRTAALVGHGAAGKTTLAEHLLFATGAITARGSVEKGNTISDFDPQEKELKHSLNSALIRLNVKNTCIHLIDVPGFPDFAGQAIGALAAVDTAIIVINAQTGIEFSTERMMKRATDRAICRMIVVNKIDAENVDLPALLDKIQARFGRECMPLNLPADNAKTVRNLLVEKEGETDFSSLTEARQAVIDQIIEEDESLMERYLENGVDPSPEDLHAPFTKALRAGHLIPILFLSAKTGAGITDFLDTLVNFAPNPEEANPQPFYVSDGAKGKEGEKIPYIVSPDPTKPLVAHVFKVVSDPYVGKLGVFRVHQGTLKKETPFFVGDLKRPFKLAHIYQLQGKEYVEVDALVPGDIGAISKIDEIVFDAVFHDTHDTDNLHLSPLPFPEPMQGLAVEPTKKSDEQRVFEVLTKLEIEDPCFKVERHPVTNETVIRGLGEMHLRVKLARLKEQFKIELSTKPPRIAYRETITGKAEGHCRHKKQSGGAGQFGEVALKIEPLTRGAGFEFVDQVKGGAIPGVFMAAVEKGVVEALHAGVVGGFPMHDVRVIVYDGKSHPVDSKDIAFYSAGKKATIDALIKALPIILEPVVDVEVLAPEAFIGDIAGDLSGKRGQITGTESKSANVSAVFGKVPLAELDDYQGRVKSLTGGQGSYTLNFSHFAAVPLQTQQQLASQKKVVHEEE